MRFSALISLHVPQPGGTPPFYPRAPGPPPEDGTGVGVSVSKALGGGNSALGLAAL